MIIVTSKKNVQRCFSKERKPRHVLCRIAASVVAGANAPGMWRSPVAQRSGGPEVASSNLVIPTKEEMRPTTSYVVRRFFFCSVPFSCPYAVGISGCKFSTSKNTCSLCAVGLLPPRGHYPRTCTKTAF